MTTTISIGHSYSNANPISKFQQTMTHPNPNPNNQTNKPNTGEIQHKYNMDDLVIIDDEAGFAFNNGTFGGEGHETWPGTLAEGATLELAYVRNNETFCLGVSESLDGDEGDLRCQKPM
jgi:hypothetical protein